MTDPRPLRLLRATVLAVLLGAPSPAVAHGGRSAPAATDARAVVRLIEPPVAGLRIAILDGDLSVWLAPPSRVTAVVRGFAGEPFLRLSEGRVAVNDRSPEAHTLGLARGSVPIVLDPNAPPVWRTTGSGDHLEWHEHRLAAPSGRWQLTLVIGGVAVSVSGTEERGPAPPLWLYLLAIALVTGAAALVRPSAPSASISFAAMLSSAIGGGLAGPHSRLAVGGAAIGIALSVGLAGAVLAATPRLHRPWAAGGLARA